jgi:SagB-type dehydrogenase family enzyme
VISNRDVDAARKYHNGTKHSYISIRTQPHSLDWENKPLLFKIYPTLEVMRLPLDFKQTGVAALSAISAPAVTSAADSIPDLDALAQLLFFSAGVTRSRKFDGGEIFFRAAACTGALYEIELYVVCGDLPGLTAGVYHYGVAESGLRELRKGDFREVLVKATNAEPSIAHAPLTLICTGVYWRNSWKYRSRTYRHFGWDSGTLLANTLAVSNAQQLPSKIVEGFVDRDVNALLDLDTRREVALTLVPVGHLASAPIPPSPLVEPLRLTVVPYSKTEEDYPAMRQIHEASSFALPEEVEAWRHAASAGAEANQTDSASPANSEPLNPKLPRDTIEQVVLRRGSTRRFSQDPITLLQLSTALDFASRTIPADFLSKSSPHLNDLYVVVNSVVGLDPGAYFYDRKVNNLELLKKGAFRDKARYLGLEQDLPGDAAADIFFLANLEDILARFGNRGYRATQLEAGIIGGKLYLAAYAQRFGATGLTFYDDDVVSFFSPHAKGKSAIFLVALGKSAKAGTAS